MAIEFSPMELEQSINNKIEFTDNGLFLIADDDEITAGDLLTAVNYHIHHFGSKYKKEHDYYVGDHSIGHLPPKEPWKPDNRIVYNFPKKAVNTFNGFFIGTPIKYSYSDKNVSDELMSWLAANSMDDVDAEVAKMASMYGRAYYLLYQDDQPAEGPDGQSQFNTLITWKSPIDTFLIYSADYKRRVRYGVTYRRDASNRLIITLYTDQTYSIYVENTEEADWYLNSLQSFTHPFGMVPIIEAPENEERQALCEDIVTLIDAMDKAMSEKANDVDYFADAYLVLKNAYVDDKQVKEIRSNRLININGENAASADANFLAKPDADTTQENLINRLVDAMYQISNVVNLEDDSFSGNISGVALQMKFQAMQDMARTKSLKFRKALRQVIQAWANVQRISLDQAKLDIKFTQSIPHNLTEEANFVSALYGKVPTEILYRQLSFIDDPKAAVEELKEEQRMQAADTASMLTDAMRGDNGDTEREGSEGKNSSAANRGR